MVKIEYSLIVDGRKLTSFLNSCQLSEIAFLVKYLLWSIVYSVDSLLFMIIVDWMEFIEYTIVSRLLVENLLNCSFKVQITDYISKL